MSADSQLKLKYAFTSDPNPIRASVAGADPNVIDLQVMISNSHSFAVTVQRLEIQIPVGHDSAGDLSAADSLPSPTPDPSGNWQFSSSGSVVTIVPGPENSGAIGSEPILCTLPGLQVNTQPSAGVPITVTEFYPSGPKVSDPNSYLLVKQEADFPVTNFYADPKTLFDQDQVVTLFWQCSDQGNDYSYALRSDEIDWQPRDCLNDADCYNCADGSGGVQTPALALPQGTSALVFFLDVIAADAEGERKLHARLETTVRVLVPSVSQNSFAEQLPYISGRLVRLHWLAFNAGQCTVELDGTTIAENAPSDTYHQGYPVLLDGPPGEYELSVTAHAQSGIARATFLFPQVTIKNPIAGIGVNGSAYAVAVTPDGSLAIVPNYDGEDDTKDFINFIDLKSRQTTSLNISGFDNRWPNAIAITPDGALALTTNQISNSVTVIDVATRKIESHTIPVGSSPSGIAITPDGKLALVTNFDNDGLSIIDIAGRKVEQTIKAGKGPVGVAVTPDGSLAFVAEIWGDTVTVIDIATRQAEPQSIGVGSGPTAIAITPDGKLALVTNTDPNAKGGGQSVTVIDIASRQAEPAAIPVASFPQGIAITPDGSFAVVSNDGGNAVSVIDIASRRVIPNVISLGRPSNIALTPDGTTAITTSGFYGKVSFI
jgi:YVTN family beta-propeller protein